VVTFTKESGRAFQEEALKCKFRGMGHKRQVKQGRRRLVSMFISSSDSIRYVLLTFAALSQFGIGQW
jgi:hypothetical protein